MSKIYVGNLPFSATEDAVRELFSAHGTVDSVALINDRDTGQPRGFGFVEMTSNSEAAKAIQTLNGFQMGGRALKVNEALTAADWKEEAADGPFGGRFALCDRTGALGFAHATAAARTARHFRSRGA